MCSLPGRSLLLLGELMDEAIAQERWQEALVGSLGELHDSRWCSTVLLDSLGNALYKMLSFGKLPKKQSAQLSREIIEN